jgi:hypothetical protein
MEEYCSAKRGVLPDSVEFTTDRALSFKLNYDLPKIGWFSPQG